MAEPIRISALGRDAVVGNFYNYFTDEIFPSDIDVPKVSKSISVTSNQTAFVSHEQTDKFKRHMLGINSHLYDSIENRFLDVKKLWFANYLDENFTKSNDSEAQVIVFILVARRIEILDPQFIALKMWEYQQKSRGRATHLMEQVVYGAEMICSIRKVVDLSRETKRSVEKNLYLAAQDYFGQVKYNSAITEFPSALDKVTCTLLDSLQAGNEFKGSFQQLIQHLRDKDSFCEDERSEKWKPIEILLRDIPAQVETKMFYEGTNDIALLKEQNEVTWAWIVKESRDLLNHPSLNRFPPFERVMCQFKDLQKPLWREIEKFYENSPVYSGRTLTEMKPISDLLTQTIDWLTHRRNEIENICSLLAGTQLAAIDLEEIKTRTHENHEKVAKVFILKVDYNQNPLIEHIQKIVGHNIPAVKLPIFVITKSMEEYLVKVKDKLNDFASEADLSGWGSNGDTDYYIGLVPTNSPFEEGEIENIQYPCKQFEPCLPTSDDSSLILDSRQSQASSCSAPCSPLTSTVVSTKKPQNQQQLQNLDIEHATVFGAPAPILTSGERYHNGIDLVENQTKTYAETSSVVSSDSDSIGEIGSNAKSAGTMKEFYVKNETNSYSSSEITRSEETGQDPIDADFSPIHGKCTQGKSTASFQSVAHSILKSSTSGRSQDFIDNVDHEREKTKSNSPYREEETRQFQEKESKVSETGCRSNRQQQGECQYGSNADNQFLVNKEPLLNQNIAEIFSTDGQYSKLIKKGQPKIFLLNAKDSLISDDFRSFDIGQPEGALSSYGKRNHKVILLMGATGCGKSTLINGMVNYILGVKWNDPFRFKCVRDDETTAKNQAHSQTSSVTAYTLHHHEGMAVPYSITIIDTPGYGDTRGVKRDKEITRKIHQFLTQQETRVEEIHAACFVAASGDSRLTTTQRYIIDSVLSIFGKDVKENIRLLVTFADNAHPPVVAACLAANFPVTSASDEITFSKFNSSVLYASNDQQGDDEFCFDQLFWDMGQENFHKFFTMLEGMNGRDLKSTRNVIQSRGLLEQSLKDIEQELEVCFVKIENMEMFYRKMKEYGHKMESNKNFTFEKTETRLTKFPCGKGFFAYNCRRCRDTCERPIKLKNSEKIQTRKSTCYKQFCTCPGSEHEYQTFEWRLAPVKITTTLKDMKAEYESNYDSKVSVEQLLADCSHELNMAKVTAFSLLDQVGKNVSALESTALRSNTLSPSDYLSMMKSRVVEEQAPGYLTRLETLTELQNYLAASASASTSNMMASLPSSPNQTHRLSNTSGASHSGHYESDNNKDKKHNKGWLATFKTSVAQLTSTFGSQPEG